MGTALKKKKKLSFWVFFFFMVSFAVQKLVNLIRSHWFIFSFISVALGESVVFNICTL